MRTVWAVFSMARPIDWRNPPGGVRGELEPLAPVELLDGVDETEVALLDEVGQRQARPLVLAGDGNDEAKVGVDELRGGVFAGGMALRSSASCAWR